MNCFLTRLTSLSPSETKKAFISPERKLLATIAEDSSLRLYQLSDEDQNPVFLRELRDHQAPIVSVQFAPLGHKSYLLLACYDKSLFLYNLDDVKSPGPLFSFVEESKEVGFFTCAAFAPTERTRLVFLVGTSNGAVLIFDSKGHFEAKIATPLDNHIKAIYVSRQCEVIALVNAKGAVLFPDLSLSNYIEFGEPAQLTSKASQITFAPEFANTGERLIFTAGEDKIAIWRFNSERKEIVLEKAFDLGGKVAGAFWNLSGLSVTVFLEKKGQGIGSIGVVHVARSLEGNGQGWVISSVNVVS